MRDEDSNPIPQTTACWREVGVWGPNGPQCPELQRVIHCHNCDVFNEVAREVYREKTWDVVDISTLDASGDELLADGDSTLVPLRFGDTWIGLPPPDIFIISEIRPIRAVPHRSHPALMGITAIQGEVLACVEVSELFGISRHSDEEKSGFEPGKYERMVVIHCQQQRIAFPVDEVRGVQHFFEKDLRSPEQEKVTLSVPVNGVLPLNDADKTHVHLLDIDELSDELMQVLR